MECPRCGYKNILPSATFCPKCGQPLGQGASQMKGAQPMPSRPSAPKMPQRPSRPVQPQRPMAAGAPVPPDGTKAARPMQPGRPVQPVRPQQPGSDAQKGFMANLGRAVGNFVSGGALNRDIQRQRDEAARVQAQADRGDIRDAQQAQQTAEQAQIRAEREAERARDQRAMDAVDGLDVVRGRAIWNNQSGEIARRISERELEEVEKLKGIIVQEGCTALIFANGELVTTLSSGAYLFYKSVQEEQAAIKKAVEEAEKQLSEAEKRQQQQRRQEAPTFRQLGIVGEIGRGFNFLGRIIFGEKKNENKDKVKKRRLDYARLLARLTQAPVLSVYLISNRYVTLTFGGALNADGALDYQPYTIPMGIHDVQIGVSLQMQINDIHVFATNYLADRNRVTAVDIQQMVSPVVENVIRQTLRNTDYQQEGLPQDTVNALKVQITDAINHQVYGIACTSVLSITDKDADFERFRQVERQLFNTEKELGFLQRTGEFRNRLENENNHQQVQSAQNEEQLRYALQQINRDQLVHDDELEEFVNLLQSQKRIREAKTEEQEFEALQDLRKNRLVKEDEMEALEDELQHAKIPRNEVTEIMRINSQQHIDDARTTAEWALSDKITDHEWERQDLERRRNWGIEDEERERKWKTEDEQFQRTMDQQRQRDAYSDERDEHDFQRRQRDLDADWQHHQRQKQEEREDRQMDYQMDRQTKFDDDQIDANRTQRQIDKLKAMAEMQAQSDAQAHQHEENMANIQAGVEMNRTNAHANMSADQIRADQLSSLSSEAQVAMANAYGSDKENALRAQQQQEQKELYDRMLQSQQEQMMKMAQMMQQGMMGVSQQQASAQQQRYADMEQQRDQYRDDARHQQERIDHTQDTALGGIGKVSEAAAANLGAFNGGVVQAKAQTAQPATPQDAQTEMIDCQCYNCGKQLHIAVGTPKCPYCSAPFQWQ